MSAKERERAHAVRQVSGSAAAAKVAELLAIGVRQGEASNRPAVTW